MSWTYISGTIEVDVLGRTQAEINYILTTILNHLPRVSGSEKDMEVYVNRREGHNCSSSADEYDDRTNNLINLHGVKDQSTGWLRKQSLYVLTVRGDLRDCTFEPTFRSFMNWLCRLSKRLEVTSVLVRICEGDHNTVINASGWNNTYEAMWEKPSWSTDNPDRIPCWWEHLMWNCFKDYNLPLSLLVKYYNEPEADEAWEAKMKERERIYYERKQP